jgi:hypothetical protein
MLSRPLPFNHARYFRQRVHQIFLAGKTNSPYLSCDSFAALADYYAYGKSGNDELSLRRLKKAQVIFVAGHNLRRLLNENFAKITASVIICGNSDENFDTPVTFPNSVRLWLCQNNSMPNDLFKKTIPIGIENIRLARAGFPKDFSKLNRNLIVDRIAMPPMSATNQIRYQAVEEALKRPLLFDVYRDYLPNNEYVEFFRDYLFMFSCEGNGYENHRIWETLYRGSFPVMFDTPWARTLLDLNLPILIVHDFSELSASVLNQHKEKWHNFNPKTCQELWIPFWENLIKETIDSV